MEYKTTLQRANVNGDKKNQQKRLQYMGNHNEQIGAR